MSKLHVRSVSKSYQGHDGGRLSVLSNIELSVESGQFLSIVGPSGCGKSTLLRLIAGLDQDYEGSILLNGNKISAPSLARGIVFQDHRLLPWLTLEQNVALSLENAPGSSKEKARLVREHISLVGLNGFENAYPYQLSGGMAQRGAIARALVNKPEVLLLDEPLGALDALTRLRLQDELLRIWRYEKTTMILVTHDVGEAIFLSNEIAVMSAKPGRISRRVTVDLDYPRSRASREFVALQSEVLAEMNVFEAGQEAA
ncbi:ABC transporter related protein [Rhodomicrobium vannielii ATCC 17100]|uniref:ABC transporter related protein n=1 Tax=Rhodomicrobium vannielii (strain ATCC 17100 / DSM 162 / LMG 4299 / NCIMB 10020 / ATH 3.1.1) TaxID=648757 RepID=E3I4U9_RHOVT|nr:ABC transporter ATP-binding protein [Rhodomicrobium vannielii]ADP72771.1 ABC transporter related protein [Rhodomicrobium vannielii ATCC 17100]